MSWRRTELIREAWSNLAANPARSLLLILGFALCLGALAFLELRDAANLRAFAANYRESGGYIAVVSSEGGIDSATCEDLNGTPGIVAAGSMRLIGQVSFSSAPGVLFQSVQVTSGALRVWAPRTFIPANVGGPAYAVGPALAAELGLRPGLLLAPLGEEPATLAAVLDVGKRNPQSARWLADIAPPSGKAQECWVEFEPGAYDAGLASLAARFATGDREPLARPFTRRDQFTRDPSAELSARPQRYGWALVAAILVGLGVLVAWFRRAEYGLYLALGATRRQLLELLFMDSALVVTTAFVLGFLWACAIQRLLGEPLSGGALRLAAITAGSCALAVVALAPVLALAAVRGNIAALLKDR